MELRPPTLNSCFGFLYNLFVERVLSIFVHYLFVVSFKFSFFSPFSGCLLLLLNNLRILNLQALRPYPYFSYSFLFGAITLQKVIPTCVCACEFLVAFCTFCWKRSAIYCTFLSFFEPLSMPSYLTWRYPLITMGTFFCHAFFGVWLSLFCRVCVCQFL